jgi:hypothetical protein
MQIKRAVQRLLGVEARALARIRAARAQVRPSEHLASSEPQTLAAYAGRAVVLSSQVKQGAVALPAQRPIAFADPVVRDYLIAAGWAIATDDPPELVFPYASVPVDETTVHAATGRSIMGG